ncbi:hypothetical protein Q2941_43970 [Bradyrhizobium sp. UFLA05-153]
MSAAFAHAVAPPATPLVDGRDAQIIACERDGSPRVIAVRWASTARYGFPRDGYTVLRAELMPNGTHGPQVLLGVFRLPDTANWYAFATDVSARAPVAGPWFPAIAQSDLGFLLPVIRFADLRTPDTERPVLCARLAQWFGNPHETDAELAWQFWRHAPPPSLRQLLADPATVDAIHQFYWSQCVGFLHLLAQRFEYAVLIGLAVDDARAPPSSPVRYFLRIDPDRYEVVESQEVSPGRRCRPAAPAWCRAERVPGSVPHPAFAHWPTWAPPAPFASVDPDGQPLPARAFVPRSPSAYTALSWDGPPPPAALLTYDPVLYRIRRFDHGASTAAQGTAPVLPARTQFQEIVPGELLRRGDSEPHFTDLPGMSWPPLEGWYDYEVVGLDLFGVPTPPAPRTAIRHFDDFAPPAPGVRVTSGHTSTFAQNSSSNAVDLTIDWSGPEDFDGPDTREFRVAVQYVPLELTPVRIEAVADAGLFNVEVSLSGWIHALGSWSGAVFSVPGTDYPAVSAAMAGPLLKLTVRKVGDRLPAAGMDGLVRRAGTPLPLTRIARLPRTPASPCTVTAANFTVAGGMHTLIVHLASATGSALPANPAVSLYLHLMRATFNAGQSGSGQWTLAEPKAASPARALWDKCVADPGALVGSPGLLFPPHAIAVTLTQPPGFLSGTATLAVTAADGAAYRSSPGLPVADSALANLAGNEGPASETIVSIRSLQPPQKPGVLAYDPLRRLWASSAAQYAEFAQFDVRWTAAFGAARYEVWRALDAALGAITVDDLALRAAAATAPNSAFEMRTDQVFGTHFVDNLPGRAPTRAVYRIRSISAAEERGAFSDVIGPVYVPDVRPPAQPNLLRVVAVNPAEQDSAISIEWTQPGDQTDVRYEIDWREEQDTRFQSAGAVRDAAPAADGRFRFLHNGRVPGRRYAYRVRSVREALDPIDPTATARRDIESLPSQVRVGSAITARRLVPPDTVTAMADAAQQSITVSWTNRDIYDAIELWRRPVDRNVFLRIGQPVTGQQQQLSDTSVQAGIYVYQLRARLGRRSSRSFESEPVQMP